MLRPVAVLLAVASLTCAAPASAALFSDNFESGLGQWQDKATAVTPATNGAIVADPLNAANNVLNFRILDSAGSILSVPQFSTTGGPFVLTFDYLGYPQAGSVPDDFGGFGGVGVAAGDPCNCWLAGTQAGYSGAFGPVTHLVDDGQWHSYSITFDPSSQGALGSLFRLMLEDFSGSGGVPGDAYFDNITLAHVPEPSTYALMLAGLATFVLLRRRT
jgi:hypothetical protein